MIFNTAVSLASGFPANGISTNGSHTGNTSTYICHELIIFSDVKQNISFFLPSIPSGDNRK
jgi:hypothetical protein